MSNSDLLPCEVNAHTTCATCNLHNNGCPIEAMCGVLGAYDIVKAFNPIKTTANAGANVQALVKANFRNSIKIYSLIFLIGLTTLTEYLIFYTASENSAL